MFEIRIHGRGGQGAVTASEILAIAAFNDGKYSQAFPKFGPERTGAPVEAYCRISDRPIKLRTHSYEPDYIIVMDESLLAVTDITAGIKNNGAILLNSNKDKNLGYRTYEVDATKISLQLLGKNIVNTAMLGAFSRAFGLVSLESVTTVIKEKFPPNVAENNVKAAAQAYEECREVL